MSRRIDSDSWCPPDGEWWVCDIGWPQAPGPCSEPIVKRGMLRPVSLSAPKQHTSYCVSVTGTGLTSSSVLMLMMPSPPVSVMGRPSVTPPWSEPPGPGSGKTFWLITYCTAYCLRVYSLPHSGPGVRRLRLRRDPVTHLTCQVTLRHKLSHLIQQIGNKRNEASNSQEWSSL